MDPTEPDAIEAVDGRLEFTDRAVYAPDAGALVVADLHLGRAAASNVDAPIGDGADVLGRLESTLEWIVHEFGGGPETVVVAGDLLHSFSTVPRGVEADLAALEETVGQYGGSLVVTPGNHDALLESMFDGETERAYRIDEGTVVAHGHERPSLEAELYVIGHDHPALAVEGRKLPCFLYGSGTYRGADVLMLPAFTRAAPGATVNGMSGGDFQSPLVVDAGPFRPGVYDSAREELLWFPPLERCRSLL